MTLLTVPEAARWLRVSRRTVERLASRGSLRPVRIGTRVLFTEDELRAFVAHQQTRRVA